MTKPFNIVVLWLMDYDGNGLLTGGLERWCRDLAYFVQSKGYDVTIYQKANKSFLKNLTDSVKVVGVPCSLRFHGNWQLSHWLEPNTDIEAPFVFVSQEIALSKKIRRAVAVNHGIWWDGDYPGYKKWLNKKVQYKLLMRLRGVICVDTNYINWCHAELRNREKWQHKLFYVPNYADLELFPPNDKLPQKHEELIILFPRRIPEDNLWRQGRGAGLLLKTAEILYRRGIKLRLLFAGRGQLQGPIREWAIQHNMAENVETFEVSLDEMPAVYARADVVVIPSIAHEGTSFSAIEAIVSGKSTVVSHIGGLANIVIDGLNGYICDPTPDSLANAIGRAIQTNVLSNPVILGACRNSLSKERWKKQIWNILVNCLEL